jgi:hypothetical protein
MPNLEWKTDFLWGFRHGGPIDSLVTTGLPVGHPGLLLRRLEYIETALGLNPTQVDYADYRDSGGVKIPIAGPLRGRAEDSQS